MGGSSRIRIRKGRNCRIYITLNYCQLSWLKGYYTINIYFLYFPLSYGLCHRSLVYVLMFPKSNHTLLLQPVNILTPPFQTNKVCVFESTVWDRWQRRPA